MSVIVIIIQGGVGGDQPLAGILIIQTGWGKGLQWEEKNIMRSINYLSPSMFRKNGFPSVSSEQWSISPKQVLMVASVVESLGTPHLRSHSIKWIDLPSHHSRSSGTTCRPCWHNNNEKYPLVPRAFSVFNMEYGVHWNDNQPHSSTRGYRGTNWSSVECTESQLCLFCPSSGKHPRGGGRFGFITPFTLRHFSELPHPLPTPTLPPPISPLPFLHREAGKAKLIPVKNSPPHETISQLMI